MLGVVSEPGGLDMEAGVWLSPQLPQACIPHGLLSSWPSLVRAGLLTHGFSGWGSWEQLTAT